MKKLITLFAAALLSACVFAQTQDYMSYQAVIRDAGDNLITNQDVGLQISILQGSVSGPEVYVEKHFPQTNANGLISIEIGDGLVIEGNYEAIDWTADSYFLKTEVDPNGGVNYTITGTSQFLTVPYAFHSKSAETLTGAYGLINIWSFANNCPGSLSSVTTTYQQVADLGTFNKEVGASTIIVNFNGRISVESMTGNGVRFVFRINGVELPEGLPRIVLRSSEVGSEGINASIMGVWEDLPAGPYTVSLYARTTAGTATNATVDSGCFSSGHTVVQEIR